MNLRTTPTLLCTAMMLTSMVGCDEPDDFGPIPDLPFERREPVERNALVPAVVRHADDLAPISGGTLLVTPSDYAVVSDPDHDRIYSVPLAGGFSGSSSTRGVIQLEGHEEPGRLAQGPENTVFVVLRRAGDIVAVDATAARITSRWHVCAAPRGLAFDSAQSLLRVACAGGEIVTFNPTADNAPMRTVKVDDDLRDVVLTRHGFSVTRFRSAEVLEFNPDSTLRRRVSLRTTDRTTHLPQGVGVAWRAVATPDGGLAVIHQRMLRLEDLRDVDAEASEAEQRAFDQAQASGSLRYGASRPAGRPVDPDNCKPGLVQSVLTMIPPDGPALDFPPLIMAPLPVDLVWGSDGAYVATAGFSLGQGGGVRRVEFGSLEARPRCSGQRVRVPGDHDGQAVALAQSRFGVVTLTRSPAVIHTSRGDVVLDTAMTADTGHALFHAATPAGLACASCHPEGGDDAHVWRFTGNLPRRTQSLHGGVAGTFPLHWEGDMSDFSHLMGEVFVQRMGGAPMPATHATALEGWINTIRSPEVAVASQPAEVPAAAARGREIFNRNDVGCVGCHSGARFTSSATVDVGTGEALQVPSLTGLRWRAPYMHNGCAPTLRDRFTNPACGGGDRHGVTSHLGADEINDLIAYLETL